MSQTTIAAVQALRLDLDKLVARFERDLATTLGRLKQPSLAEAVRRTVGASAMPPIGTVAQLPSTGPESRRRSIVKPLLDKKGWSINDWAVQSGVDFHTADRYLKGLSSQYPSTRLKLANSLNINVEDLPS